MTAATPPDTGRDFNGRVALVTGAGSGIGRATALAFADRDARVAVVGNVNVTGGEETVSLIEDCGGEATFVEADVTDDAAVERMVETAIAVYGRLDFAHNNAGISGERVPTSEYPDDAWQRVIDVNLSGVWRCLKHELSRMDQGSIVNTASAVGKVGLENLSAYVASKHGVLGLTKVAALECAPEIRVNAVCPGFIETPMTEHLRTEPERYEFLVSKHAMERFGRPEEVAAAVVWLCSDEASFVTGEGLGVEGGTSADRSVRERLGSVRLPGRASPEGTGPLHSSLFDRRRAILRPASDRAGWRSIIPIVTDRSEVGNKLS